MGHGSQQFGHKSKVIGSQQLLLDEPDMFCRPALHLGSGET